MTDYKIPHGVEVFIYRHTLEGIPEFLLMLRHPDDGGFWQGPGGGVEIDETFEETARRELAEECGLKIGAVSRLNMTLEFPLQPDEIGTRFAPGITHFTIHFMAAPLLGKESCPTYEMDGDRQAHIDHRWVTLENGLQLLQSEPHRAGLQAAARHVASLA